MLCTKVCSRLNSTSDGDADFIGLDSTQLKGTRFPIYVWVPYWSQQKLRSYWGTPLERSCRNFRTASQETCGTRVKAVGLISTK